LADLQPSRPPQNFPSEGADNNNRPSQARRNYRAASSLPPSPSNANKQTSPPVEALSSNIAPQHATVFTSCLPSAKRTEGAGIRAPGAPSPTADNASSEGGMRKAALPRVEERVCWKRMAETASTSHQRQKYRGQQMMRSAEDLCPSSENGQALSDRENRSSGESGMPPPRGAGGDRVKGNERAPPTK